jgi:ser/thr/tyr protein kinase RAD53
MPKKPILSLSKITLSMADSERHQIGRAVSRHNQTVLKHKSISNFHCRIWRESRLIHVEDLSSNGTWVREKKVGKNLRTLIQHGDTVCNSQFIWSRSGCLALLQLALGGFASSIQYVFRDPTKPSPIEPNDFCNAIGASYDFVGTLGSGGFATVSMGVHRKTGQTVAIKCVSSMVCLL